MSIYEKTIIAFFLFLPFSSIGQTVYFSPLSIGATEQGKSSQIDFGIRYGKNKVSVFSLVRIVDIPRGDYKDDLLGFSIGAGYHLGSFLLSTFTGPTNRFGLLSGMQLSWIAETKSNLVFQFTGELSTARTYGINKIGSIGIGWKIK